MALVTKNDVTQIFAIQAPEVDLPPTFANYPRGWDTARSNNGKPTIKQFNYIQQRTDQNVLWIHQNGAALPYDAAMEYAEGAVVVKDGELQKKQGASWVSATNKGYNLDYFVPGKSYPLHAEIMLTNGDIVRSTIDNNTANPNTDMTGWVKTNDASQIFDGSMSQKQINESKPEDFATYAALRSYSGNKGIAIVGGRENYFDGGFGSFALKLSDTTSIDNDGTILIDSKGRRWHRIITTEFGHAEWFGLSNTRNDNNIIIEKCLNACGSAFIPVGEFVVSDTVKVLSSQLLIGVSEKSCLTGNLPTKGAIITHDGSLNTRQYGASIKSMRVKGTFKYAYGLTHCTQSEFEDLSCAGSTLEDGFIFEFFWNTHIHNLKTNGATITGTPFKINKVVLNTEFRALYSSNITNYILDINADRSEISNGTDVGFGRIIIEGLAAQGANKYGINLIKGNTITFNTVYFENCLSALLIRDASDIQFNNCDMGASRAATNHQLYIEAIGNGSTGINFNNCLFLNSKELIIGKTSGYVNFNDCRMTGNAKIFPNIKRTANTQGAMPVCVRNNGGTGEYSNVVKTNNFAWKFVEQTISDTFALTSTVLIPSVSANPIN